MWDGIEGGVACYSVDEKRQGRGKEGYALLLAPRVWNGIETCGRQGV